MGFVGTVWCAHQLKPATCNCDGTGPVFHVRLGLFGKPNIHGDAGGLLLLVLFPALLLGALLLEKGVMVQVNRQWRREIPSA